MSKRKINPKDLYVNLELLTEIVENGKADTASEEMGTGSLCISVVVCMPTEKNCNPTVSEGQICLEITRQNNCTPSVDNCISSACFTPSVQACLVTTDGCAVKPVEPVD